MSPAHTFRSVLSLLLLLFLLATTGYSEARLPFPITTLRCPGAASRFGGCPHRTFRGWQRPSDVRTMAVYNDRAVQPSWRGLVGVDHGAEWFDENAESNKRTVYPPASLRLTGTRGEFDIRHGMVNDGVTHATVSAYLQEAMHGSVCRFSVPPIVRFVGEHFTEDDIILTGHALQLVNTALPLGWKIQWDPDTPSNPGGTVRQDGKYYASGNEELGTLYVEFLPDADFYASGTHWGHAWIWELDGGGIEHSYVQISDAYRGHGDRQSVMLLAHELIHALGIDAHVDVLGTLMTGALREAYAVYQSARRNGQILYSKPQPLSVLYPADREALRVLYGRLENGDDPVVFGDWTSVSTHLHGNGQHAAFGVVLRNDYAEPWAYGDNPTLGIAYSSAVVGTSVWQGALLGFTPDWEPVAGDAMIVVNVDYLFGFAEFTNLESWPAGVVPGNAGGGILWGDGTLRYVFEVTGNQFMQADCDDDFLTGTFFGSQYEGAGGTLERDDLTAAFGGNLVP